MDPESTRTRPTPANGCGPSGGASSGEPAKGHDSDTSQKSRPKHWPTFLRPGDPVTAEGLQHIKPLRFIYEMMNRQATQPITGLTSEHCANARQRLHRTDHLYVVTRRILDYPHHRATQASTSDLNGELDVYRCVNGKQYRYSGILHEWGLSESSLPCTDLGDERENATDGISRGGPTPHQADLFMARLLVLGTLIQPRQPRRSVDHGHRYIRMVVDYTPVKDATGVYWGVALIDQAYFRAGLPMKPLTFTTEFRAGQGMHVICYIDPKTLLPSYSRKLAAPMLDKQGHVELREGTSSVYQYRFPSRLPAFNLKGKDPVVIDPPEGMRID